MFFDDSDYPKRGRCYIERESQLPDITVSADTYEDRKSPKPPVFFLRVYDEDGTFLGNRCTGLSPIAGGIDHRSVMAGIGQIGTGISELAQRLVCRVSSRFKVSITNMSLDTSTHKPSKHMIYGWNSGGIWFGNAGEYLSRCALGKHKLSLNCLTGGAFERVGEWGRKSGIHIFIFNEQMWVMQGKKQVSAMIGLMREARLWNKGSSDFISSLPGPVIKGKGSRAANQEFNESAYLWAAELGFRRDDRWQQTSLD